MCCVPANKRTTRTTTAPQTGEFVLPGCIVPYARVPVACEYSFYFQCLPLLLLVFCSWCSLFHLWTLCALTLLVVEVHKIVYSLPLSLSVEKTEEENQGKEEEGKKINNTITTERKIYLHDNQSVPKMTQCGHPPLLKVVLTGQPQLSPAASRTFTRPPPTTNCLGVTHLWRHRV